MNSKRKEPVHRGRMASTVISGKTLEEFDINLHNFLQTLDNVHSVESHHNECIFYAVVVYKGINKQELN